MTDTIDIDPESPALEYRIIEINGEWILAPANPGFPRTPAENEFLVEVQNVLPAYGGGQFRIPDKTRERLDAEPGDVIPISAVVQVHASVFIEGVSEAFEGMLKAIEKAALPIIEGLGSVFENRAVHENESSDDRDDRLPEPIREARARREEQRENADQQLGSDRFAGRGDRR